MTAAASATSSPTWIPGQRCAEDSVPGMDGSRASKSKALVCGVVVVRILELALDEDPRQVDADERHHQRRDDLVEPVARLQQRGRDRPRRSDDARYEEEENEVQRVGQVLLEARTDAGDHSGSEQELSVHAEVPDPRLEDDDEADGDEQQRGDPYGASPATPRSSKPPDQMSL